MTTSIFLPMFRKETDNHKPDHRRRNRQGSESGNLGIPFHIAHDAAKQEWKISHYRVALLGSQADQQSCYKVIHLHLQHPGRTRTDAACARFGLPARVTSTSCDGGREGATAGVNPGGLAPLWGVDGGEEMRVSGAISRPVLFFYGTHELVFSPLWSLTTCEIRELPRSSF